MTTSVLTTLEDGILVVQLNRPEKRNALTLEMYQTLNQNLKRVEEDENIKVVILKGTEDFFTAGNDLSDFIQATSSSDLKPVIDFLYNLNLITKPFIAAINGGAVGIGSTLLPFCDLVYAKDNAFFKTPFVDLGICPEAGSSFLFPQIMGQVRASEFLLLGEKITANRAQEMGLINKVVKTDAFVDAMVQAKILCSKPSNALITAKSLLRRAQRSIIKETISLECEQFFQLLTSKESRQVMQAFYK